MAMPIRLRGCIEGWILPATIEKRDKSYMLLDLVSMLPELELELELELGLELAAAKH